MSDDFFDKDELKNLPPLERAKLIKQKKEELEKKLEQEAELLEEESRLELERQQEELDKIIEQELEEKKRREESQKRQAESFLEKTISESPEANEEHKAVEYGPHVETKNQYETGNTSSGNPEFSILYDNNSKVGTKEEELGSRFYSEKPKNDYI